MNRFIEFNKDFQPSSVDAEDECFPNGIFEFNITKLTKFIEKNPLLFPVEFVSVDSLVRYDESTLDPEVVHTADISNPIILAEISPEKFNVIDGNHRLAKARKLNQEKIPTRRILVEHHIAFLTSTTAYKAFVEYWNSKLK